MGETIELTDEDIKALRTGDWKGAAVRWLVNQGVSTVLLFAILAGGFYAAVVLVPQHLAAINEGYREINEVNQRAVQQQREADATFRTLINASHDRALEQNARAIEKLSETIERIRERP